MEVQLYIKGQKIDLFDDEKISISLSVKNINDLSKVLTDFTQTFSVPCTKNNNAVFQHWYNADIDGTFNINIRVEAYIEVNTLPFRFGSIQLDSAKLKDGWPYSYSLTFYGGAVSLSDLFGEDMLKDLGSLSELNHNYDSLPVTESMTYPSLFGGDVYYPMINAVDEMSLQTGNARDLENINTSISYREFKPALRNIRIIEAIETKYGITLSKDFFDRAVFYNSFLWLNKETGYLKPKGLEERVDIQNVGNLSSIGIYTNTTLNEVSFVPVPLFLTYTHITCIIYPELGYENFWYTIRCYRNGTLTNESGFLGNATLEWIESYDGLNTLNTFYFTIESPGGFSYKSKIEGALERRFIPSPVQYAIIHNTNAVNLLSTVNILEQMPEMKVKDYFSSLMAQFNLIIKPVTSNNFYIDTLDSWYEKGKTYDLNKYIDIKEIQVKRPNVKKKIEFLYQKTETILGKQYFENNSVGYGDLKTNFNISGDDLKIETGFENMLFERLKREATGEQTALQVGFAIDKNLKPTKTKPFIFYRNGIEVLENNTYIRPNVIKTEYWHTATEDNIDISQVTNSLNFGSDISSYFYAPIGRSLYFNFWKNYIEDLFNKKCRVLTVTGVMPSNILYRLQMNDKFIIQDRRYKMSELKVDLTTGKFTGEFFTDFSKPTDTIDNIVPLTVDRTDITVDSEQLTVDRISTYESLYSFTTNGISINNYTATKGEENFEVKINSNTNWSIQKINTGGGTEWFSVNKINGNKTDYLRVKINYLLTSTIRSGVLRFNIGSQTFDLNITQS